MSDMLVKLYDLPVDWSFIARLEKVGISIRKPTPSENSLVLDWIRKEFYEPWVAETMVAMNRIPAGCYIAISNGEVIGFACYDGVSLGYFGPIGVLPALRKRGVGRALMMACLLEMRQKGYGYAIIGGVGPVDFYTQTLNAIPIPDSDPGIWKDWLLPDWD